MQHLLFILFQQQARGDRVRTGIGRLRNISARGGATLQRKPYVLNWKPMDVNYLIFPPSSEIKCETASITPLYELILYIVSI